MKLQLHMPGSHRSSRTSDRNRRNQSLSNRLGKAEGGFDYLAVGLIVVLGLAMAIGLATS